MMPLIWKCFKVNMTFRLELKFPILWHLSWIFENFFKLLIPFLGPFVLNNKIYKTKYYIQILFKIFLTLILHMDCRGVSSIFNHFEGNGILKVSSWKNSRLHTEDVYKRQLQVCVISVHMVHRVMENVNIWLQKCVSWNSRHIVL